MFKVSMLARVHTLLLLFVFVAVDAQSVETDEIVRFQQELNRSYADTSESPLLKDDLAGFESLFFYPINLQYRVTAVLIIDTLQNAFEMTTSTSRKPKYTKYGMLVFRLFQKTYSIPVYQNMQLMKDSAYVDYLFFPFTDLTNGDSTYGGGRYIDLKIPKSDTVVLDFNKCYQPYCAYNHKYSCPIPPIENHLEIEILAGVKNGIKKNN